MGVITKRLDEMMLDVIYPKHHFEILWRIVEFVTVNVMDNLRSF